MLKQQENAEKISDIRGDVKEIGWGSQIRSYVLQPYTMVKDHRTGEESGNVDQRSGRRNRSFYQCVFKVVKPGMPG